MPYCGASCSVNSAPASIVPVVTVVPERHAPTLDRLGILTLSFLGGENETNNWASLPLDAVMLGPPAALLVALIVDVARPSAMTWWERLAGGTRYPHVWLCS